MVSNEKRKTLLCPKNKKDYLNANSGISPIPLDRKGGRLEKHYKCSYKKEP
jgi:hypothetical protein